MNTMTEALLESANPTVRAVGKVICAEALSVIEDPYRDDPRLLPGEVAEVGGRLFSVVRRGRSLDVVEWTGTEISLGRVYPTGHVVATVGF